MNLYAVNEETLQNDIRHLIQSADLASISQRSVLKRLEDRYGIDLALFKAFIYQRAVEEARVRIDNDPNLQQQQQQRSRSKFYREINGGQSDIPYNTIYTPSNVHQSQAQPLALPLPLPKFGPPVNYSEVKAHYLNINSSSDSRKRKRETPSDGTDGEESGSSNDDNSSDGPKSKKRRLSSQSTRESDKDTVYPLSPRFQEMMGRQEGSWRLCWDWIMDHAKANQLRVGNRKIRCDEVLQKVFERQETSVSGVSRLIWKELVGAIDVDAKTGKFKKLVYRKRQKKARQSEESGGSSSSYGTEEEKEVNEKNGQSQGEIDKQFGYLSDHLARYKKHFGYQYKGSGEGTAAEKASRPKRRYRRKERDAEGNVIKKKRNSGLTRMCFMSQELKSIVGEEGPLPRNIITKGFWQYTETHGLKKKGRIIRCDAKLKAIWGDDVDEIHMYSVQRGLKEHITTMTKEEENRYKAENPDLDVKDQKESVSNQEEQQSKGPE